jgi:hypothetical protein
VYLDLKKSIKELVLKPITNRDPNIEKLIKIVMIHKKLANLFLKKFLKPSEIKNAN